MQSPDPQLRLSVNVEFSKYRDGSVLAEIWETCWRGGHIGSARRATWTRSGQTPIAEEVLAEVETALLAVIDAGVERQFGLQLRLPV